jgi:hypothetical protein
MMIGCQYWRKKKKETTYNGGEFIMAQRINGALHMKGERCRNFYPTLVNSFTYLLFLNSVVGHTRM